MTDSEFSAVFSYYNQDGNHSAVTGGIGTEKLTVYNVSYDRQYSFDSIRQISWGLGIDYISSASTDRIDFKMSSASSHDQRIYASVGYAQLLPGTSWTVGGEYSISIESDYFSNGINGYASYLHPNKDVQFDINFQYYRDDLRWRKNVFKPTELIYPAELRDTSWFETFIRNSFNLSFTIRKDLNKRLSVAFFPGIIYQTGLLSTPFHRVYFNGETKPTVETLPQSRIKIPVGFQLNSFVTPRWIVKARYQYYLDDFGINAHLFNIDVPFKISTFVTISPSVRYYTQSSSKFFNIFGAHFRDQDFYSSDFDLSGFQALKYGLEFKSISNKSAFKQKWIFDRFALRYAYYKRSDGLFAHLISTVFDFSKNNSIVH